jgi:hypothetical protein
MADQTDPGQSIPVHPLLAKLVAKPGPANVIALKGYVGPSETEDRVILYPRLGDLSECLEIARTDILAFEPAAETVLPQGGMIVWVKKDTEITHRRAETVKTQAGNFVEVRRGRLRMRLSAPGANPLRAAGCGPPCGPPPPCVSAPPPPCQSRCRPACRVHRIE